MSQILVRRLTEGKEFELTVTDLNQKYQDSFTGKNGVTKYCHFFKASYSEFPEPVDFQWCRDIDSVTEFKVGDIIKVKAGTYVASKNRQSVTFISVVPKQNQRQLMQDIADGKTIPPKQPVHAAPVNSNPQVMGSLWSICIGHAIQFNKDRVDKKGNPLTMKDVLMDAAVLENDFKQKMRND